MRGAATLEPSILQKKAEILLERDVYPLLKNFPQAEKFSLSQEIKQSCFRLIRAAVMANNLTVVKKAARMAGRGGRREDAPPRAVWSRPDAEVHHREESPRAANETQRAGAHYWRLAKALHQQPIKK